MIGCEIRCRLMQHIVDQAIVLEQADPGVDAQQERGPERQHDQHQQQIAPFGRRARDGQRHRITQQQAQHRRERRHPQRIEQRVEVQRIGEQEVIVAEMQLGSTARARGSTRAAAHRAAWPAAPRRRRSSARSGTAPGRTAAATAAARPPPAAELDQVRARDCRRMRSLMRCRPPGWRHPRTDTPACRARTAPRACACCW